MIEELQNCVTVDVGRNTALAFWRGNFEPTTCEIEWKGKNIQKELMYYLETMGESFKDFLYANCLSIHDEILLFDYIQIEGVEMWQDSLKSKTSAARGDLIALAYLVGIYFRIAQEFTKDVRIVTAPQWKGQLSKTATAARVRRINGITYKNDHITDAVAMGFANVEDIWLLKRKKSKR